MQIDNNHPYTIIASINKIYNNAKVYGFLKPKELYLLNIIYKLLNDCENCYNTKTKLISLYFKILNSSKLLCKKENTKDYIFNNFNNFYIDVNNNTSPTIDNPSPVEPEEIIPPKTCGNAFNLLRLLKTHIFTYDELVIKDCFTDQYGGYIKNIKIIQLPINGVLTYNDINVVENQIIDLDAITNFKYITFNNALDSFKYVIAGSTNPTVFNELDTVTIFLTNE